MKTKVNFLSKKILLILVSLAFFVCGFCMLDLTPAYAADEIVATNASASVRTIGDKQGIRFTSKISLEYIRGLGEIEYEIGTLVIPKSLLGENELKLGVENVIVVDHTARFEDVTGNDSVRTVNAVIYDIPDEYVAEELVARAYIKHGETTVYSETTATRSVLYVASCALNESSKYDKDGIDYLEKIVNAYTEKYVTAFSIDSTLTLEIGGSQKLNTSIQTTKNAEVKAVWSSDNTSVATVDDMGNVTAKSAGNATVTAKLGSYTAKCSVIVKAQTKELDFFAKNSSDMTIEEVESGEFAESVKVQSLKDDYDNRILFKGINSDDGKVSEGVLGNWGSKIVKFDMFYSGQSMALTISFNNGKGASYEIKISNGTITGEANRDIFLDAAGYKVTSLKTNKWYTLAFQVAGIDTESNLVGLVIWGDNPSPLYLKNYSVTDGKSLPESKTVNALGFSSSDEGITVTKTTKDDEDCMKADGVGTVWFEDVMSSATTHGVFFDSDYEYVKFDIYYESGNNFNFNTKYYDAWHNGNGYWTSDTNKKANVKVFDGNGNEVFGPTKNTWYTVYLKVAHDKGHSSSVNFALQENGVVYLRNLAFAEKFPNA